VAGEKLESGDSIMKYWRKLSGQTGQSLVEYAIILALIAMVAVLMLRSVGTTTANSMTPVNNALE